MKSSAWIEVLLVTLIAVIASSVATGLNSRPRSMVLVVTPQLETLFAFWSMGIMLWMCARDYRKRR